MYIKILLLSTILFMFTGCFTQPLKPIKVSTYHTKVNYINDVQPILNKRCVVCHSCYNSPCQLKMSSFEGLDRGRTKEKVYLSERLFAAKPTRLFIDATSTSEWREKGFTSVIDDDTNASYNNSLMLHMLSHKMEHPEYKGEFYAESDDLSCAKDTTELASYLKKHSNSGMPFGFPALNKEEFETIKAWLVQGSKGPNVIEQKKLTTPSTPAQTIITKFEDFLNQSDAKHVMSARYIYEHLFLAHIRFSEAPNEFYELLRSSTPKGKKIVSLKSIRPYDKPSSKVFYYRFRKIHTTLVHKTHIVYEMSENKLERYNELFIKPTWREEPHIMSYDNLKSANPFWVYKQIPNKSKYQFLLDDNEYVIRTFIRGPVCKGQIALNVIHDHFWVMFMNPEADISIRNPEFINSQLYNLTMPTEKQSEISAFRAFSNKYKDRAISYYNNRQRAYDLIYPDGLTMDMIYKGDTNKSTPILTVYRHFDSASVHKGVLGDLPRTAWVIDYPLFERIYYSLVAGFDVYGNLGHQVAIRRYMSRLRVEGESAFIDFLPKAERSKLFWSWYIDDKDVAYMPSTIESSVMYSSKNSKREFIENVVHNHIRKDVNINFDSINYFGSDNKHPSMPKEFKSDEDYIQAFRHVSLPATAFTELVNGFGSNLAYIRFILPDEEDVAVSVVVNRWHDSVSFMFNETDRLNPNKDDLDFIPGYIGSYPNFFLEVKLEDVPEFFDMLENYQDNPKYIAKFLKFGTARSDKDFWRVYDWFQNDFNKQDPANAALFDLNRYYYRAF